MSSNGPVKISTGTPMAVEGAPSNVATNQANMEALKQANVDGKSIKPEWVTARGINLAESLRIGSGVSILDGTITGAMVAADAINATHINATGLTASEITFGSGSLSEFGITTLGTIVGGSLAVGAGGVTIGDVSAGISISSNALRTIVAGVPTITLDGATGIITATKFNFTSDSGSTMNLSVGSITIGGTASIAGTQASTVVNNAATGTTRATTFYQATAPTANNTGDFWLDSDDYILYRWNGSNWTTQQVSSLNHTYAQTTQPSSGMVAGDFWVDTDDGNKLYRYSGSSWVAILDAVNAGGYVTVDSNNNITNINTAGINIGTATSGNRVQMTSIGIAVYNSAGNATTYMTADGFAVMNRLNTSTHESIRFLNSSSGITMAAYSGSSSDGYIESRDHLYVRAGQLNHGSMATSQANKNVYVKGSTSGGTVVLESDTILSTAKLTFEAGAVDPTITAGSAPSEGGASSQPLGSIMLAVGGSLWLTISNSGNKWTRIFGANTAAATAHP